MIFRQILEWLLGSCYLWQIRSKLHCCSGSGARLLKHALYAPGIFSKTYKKNCRVANVPAVACISPSEEEGLVWAGPRVTPCRKSMYCRDSSQGVKN